MTEKLLNLKQKLQAIKCQDCGGEFDVLLPVDFVNIATPAPPSKEVQDAIKYFVEYYLPETKITNEVSSTTIENLETLITAAKYSTDAKDSRIDFLQQQIAVLESAAVRGFTRDEIREAAKMAWVEAAFEKSSQVKVLDGDEILDTVIKALIDMGALRVAQPLQGENLANIREGGK